MLAQFSSRRYAAGEPHPSPHRIFWDRSTDIRQTDPAQSSPGGLRREVRRAQDRGRGEVF